MRGVRDIERGDVSRVANTHCESCTELTAFWYKNWCESYISKAAEMAAGAFPCVAVLCRIPCLGVTERASKRRGGCLRYAFSMDSGISR